MNEKRHAEAVLYPSGLTNFGQLGPEVASSVSLVKAQCRRMGVPLCPDFCLPRAPHVADDRPLVPAA